MGGIGLDADANYTLMQNKFFIGTPKLFLSLKIVKFFKF